MTYAGEAWGTAISDTSWRRLESTQNLNLRMISNPPLFVFNEAILNSSRIKINQGNHHQQLKKSFHQKFFIFTPAHQSTNAHRRAPTIIKKNPSLPLVNLNFHIHPTTASNLS